MLNFNLVLVVSIMIFFGSLVKADQAETKFFYFSQVERRAECVAIGKGMNQRLAAFELERKLPLDSYIAKVEFYGPYSRRQSICSVNVNSANSQYRLYKGKLSKHDGADHFEKCESDLDKAKSNSLIIWPYIFTGIFNRSCRVNYIGIAER